MPRPANFAAAKPYFLLIAVHDARNSGTPVLLCVPESGGDEVKTFLAHKYGMPGIDDSVN